MHVNYSERVTEMALEQLKSYSEYTSLVYDLLLSTNLTVLHTAVLGHA